MKDYKLPEDFAPQTQSTNRSCLAAVMAMTVGETESYVLDWFGNAGVYPPFYDEDAFIFFAHHGIYPTLGYRLELGHGEFSEELFLKATLNLVGRPAYLVVEIQGGRYHAIFWDGYRVHDPKNPEEFSLKQYNVTMVYFFMQTDKRREFFRNRWRKRDE